MLPTYRIAPGPTTGYPFTPNPFAVVLPEATVNLVTNPSVELATTGWAAVDGTIARTTVQQRHGAYSLSVTPDAIGDPGTTLYLYYGTVSLTAGSTYTASLDVLAPGGLTLNLYFATTGGVVLGSPGVFTASGRWQRIYTRYTEDTSTTRRVYLITAGSPAAYYVDGLQVEAKAYPTTYCDGDQIGLVDIPGKPAYSWDGAAHASTSRRAAYTRAGGRLMRLQDLGMLLLAASGLGMPPIQHAGMEFAGLDGGLYQGSRRPSRSFTLAGEVSGDSWIHLRQRRAELQRALDVDRVSPRQPLLLEYEPSDECGAVVGDTRQLACILNGGLEGTSDNRYAERFGAQFTLYLPYLAGGGDAGAALSTRAATAYSNAARREADGSWDTLAGGVGIPTEAVNDVLVARDGRYYFVGSFAAPGAGFARFDPVTNTWDEPAALSGGLATGHALAEGPDGLIYIAGNFTQIDATAALRIASYDPATGNVSQVGGSFNGIVYDICFDRTGVLYAVGAFTDNGAGTVPMAGLARLVSGNFAAVGTGLAGGTATGYACIAAPYQDGIFLGGDFTSIDGVSATYIGRVIGNTGSDTGAVGGGTNGIVYSLLHTVDYLYASGAGTTWSGVSAAGIARFNGEQWQALGNGMISNLYWALKLLEGPNGEVYAFTNGPFAAPFSPPGQAGVWYGSAWYPLDADFLPAGIGAYSEWTAGAILDDGTLIVGGDFNSAGNSTTSVLTVVTNPGSAPSYPVVIVNGPGYFYQIRNTTTGRNVYFNNLLLETGETVTLDFRPGRLSFTSSSRGDITPYILPGADLADFWLAPGANNISLFVDDASATASMYWRPQYLSFDE